MNFIKTHKNIIIAVLIAAAVLTLAFFYGAGPPSDSISDAENIIENEKTLSKAEPDKDTDVKNESASESEIENIPLKNDNSSHMSGEEKSELAEKIARESSEGKKAEEAYSDKNTSQADQNADKGESQSEPTQRRTAEQNGDVSDNAQTCTLSVRCDTILKNISSLPKEKVSLVPSDGVIFKEQTVTFYEGESVFNLLVREMKKNKIHLEFTNTPIYNSAYIEGINNLYEYDLGELSGWMYKVNGHFPNYGCSLYKLEGGDRVEWVYTCDLGVDVGGYYSAKNGN